MMKIREALEELKAIVGECERVGVGGRMGWHETGKEAACEVWISGDIKKSKYKEVFQEALDSLKYYEALEELKNVAGGKYCSVSFEIDAFESGRENAVCAVYIAGKGHFFGPTFTTALDKLAGKKQEEEGISS